MANNCTTPKEIKLTDKQIREYNIFLNENQKNEIKNSCLMYNYINF